MSKLIICFFFLFNFYNCEKEHKTLIFEINPKINKENEFNVKVGQEFVIKLNCISSSWVLLNKNEKGPVTFIKTEIEIDQRKREAIRVGGRDYLYYYFKSNSITKEPKLLKFTDTYSYLKQTNPTPKLVIKINVN